MQLKCENLIHPVVRQFVLPAHSKKVWVPLQAWKRPVRSLHVLSVADRVLTHRTFNPNRTDSPQAGEVRFWCSFLALQSCGKFHPCATPLNQSVQNLQHFLWRRNAIFSLYASSNGGVKHKESRARDSPLIARPHAHTLTHETHESQLRRLTWVFSSNNLVRTKWPTGTPITADSWPCVRARARESQVVSVASLWQDVSSLPAVSNFTRWKFACFRSVADGNVLRTDSVWAVRA